MHAYNRIIRQWSWVRAHPTQDWNGWREGDIWEMRKTRDHPGIWKQEWLNHLETRDIWLDRLEVFERLRTYIAMAEDERLYQPCEHMETNGISEIGKRRNMETWERAKSLRLVQSADDPGSVRSAGSFLSVGDLGTRPLPLRFLRSTGT